MHLHNLLSPRRATSRRSPRSARRLRLEWLEERLVPAQPADWRRAVLRQGILDQPADIGEVAFQHLAGKRLLGGKVVGKGARTGSGRGDYVAHAGRRVAAIPDGPETGIEKVFAK